MCGFERELSYTPVLFSDLSEVLRPHLDFLLDELLPVESFILQPFLSLLPPPPLLVKHLAPSKAFPFLWGDIHYALVCYMQAVVDMFNQKFKLQ